MGIPPAIQAWLTTVDPKDCLGDMLKVRIEILSEAEQAQWPEAIRSLKPQLVSLHLDTSRHPVVRLAWDGFDQEYGIVVGSVDAEVFKMQPTQREVTDPNVFYQYAHYMRPVAPGAYVYYAF